MDTLPVRTHHLQGTESKRILFVITQADWGGAQTFLINAAQEARRRGFAVLVAYGGTGLLEERCREAGIPTHKLKRMEREIAPGKDAGATQELVTLMREWKPTVAFLCSTKAGVVGSLAARIARVPRVIYRIGGWSFLDPVSPWQKMLRRWTEKMTAGFKDIIITNTPDGTVLAGHHGIRPRKDVVTIPNGINLETFDRHLASRDVARLTLMGSATDTRPLLLTIANFYPTKGLVGYLEALAIVKQTITDIHAVIIGDGEERSSLEAKRHALGLDETVSFLGQRSDAAALLGGADAFVLPSRKEGFPWALLEAMTARLPCVATDVGGVRWMLDGVGSVAPPQNPDALARAIIDLLRDPEAARIKGVAARRRVEERFQEKEMWEKVFEVIERT